MFVPLVPGTEYAVIVLVQVLPAKMKDAQRAIDREDVLLAAVQEY